MSLMRLYSPEERAAREAAQMECRARFRHNMKRRIHPPHNWSPPNTRSWKAAKYLLHKECQDCGTWRHQAISHRGTELAFEYVWPDGYRREPGEGRMSADELRLWEVEQVYGIDTDRKRVTKPKSKLRAVS